MIGRIQGMLAYKKAPRLLVDVHGVGYEMEAPMSTFYGLPEPGAQVSLHTHLVVREDAHLLYAFLRESERRLFRTLLKISGVGPKLALALLSGMSEQEFIRCLQHNDVDSLMRLPGVGRKTAERLIVEMRDRITGWNDTADAASVPTAGFGLEPAAADPVADAVGALVALGFKPQEASRMIRAVSTEGLASEDIIRQALQTTLR